MRANLLQKDGVIQCSHKAESTYPIVVDLKGKKVTVLVCEACITRGVQTITEDGKFVYMNSPEVSDG